MVDLSVEGAVGFGLLAARVRRVALEAVRSGVVSERRLARAAGISQPHMHHWLCGKRALSMERLDAVVEVLRIRLSELMVGSPLVV